jgi:hypothetical protein
VCVLVCQQTISDRGSCRDLPQKLPRDKTFSLADRKASYTPKTRGRCLRAQGSSCLVAGRNRKTEQHGDNIGLLTSEGVRNKSLWRGKETSSKLRWSNRPSLGTIKGSWGIPNSNCSSGFGAKNAADRLVSHRRLRRLSPIATPSTNSLTTATTTRFNTFRCATEYKMGRS